MAREITSGIETLGRANALKDVDAAVVRAIAQAAVEVELFTIPLYMCTLYSIQGTHQITGANDYYRNRLWPGSAPAVDESPANHEAFNLIFSVFIEEMLHLQLAANMATAIGAEVSFTTNALQNADHGWTCYGSDNTTIPRIVDLVDTNQPDLRVRLDELNHQQVGLFLFIEQDEEKAKGDIKKDALPKYFPKVPFTDVWTPTSVLPMFGTIGWMYQCYLDYLAVQYEDGTQLIHHVYTPNSVQRDMFNAASASHQPEYPGFSTTFSDGSATPPLDQLRAMMDAITDQGEGKPLQPSALLTAVEDVYRASRPNLEADYPQFSDTGQQLPPDASAIAAARCNHDGKDHYERFQQLGDLVGRVTTWSTWLTDHHWTADELQTGPPATKYPIPTTAEVAAALEHARASKDTLHDTISLAATGALYGITSVLDDFWKDPKVGFPFPSMVGSGDRMSIGWALFGEAPNLSTMQLPKPDQLYHACQALALDGPAVDCAAPAVYHSCRGSNLCRAQGGCGFVQSAAGGASSCGASGCSGLRMAAKTTDNLCSGPPPPPPTGTDYSAPSDNRCGSFGGCAVPISASQLLARSGSMLLYDFPATGNPEQIGRLTYEAGQNVHDVAYAAYLQVMAHRHPGEEPAPPPAPSTVRLVFPPST